MIFQMAADFRAALDEGGGERTYGEFLRFLDQYVQAHFGFESECMNRYQCPVARENNEAHAIFITVLGKFAARQAAQGFVTSDARSLVDTIDRWLLDHICGIDVKLKATVPTS